MDESALADGLARLFDANNLQRVAAEAAVRRRFAVVAGGPGTGKTTTVARIVALLAEQSESSPLVALAAPTGKAAARLEEAVHAEAATLDVTSSVRETLLSLNASTLHRLLGWRPDSHSRFRHNRANRLPHDVVIVDETSMVSLSLMARLVEAVRPEARLVLVGDPGQLTSIEAGAVLGDIVRAGGDGVVVLEHVYRYGAGIDELAAAIRIGDGDAVIARARGRPRRCQLDRGGHRRPRRDGGARRRSARVRSRRRTPSSRPRARATPRRRSTPSAPSASSARTGAAATA